MKISDYKLGFLGFGHMAQIIFKAIDQAKLIPRSSISFIRKDPKKMKQSEKEFKITSTSLKNLVQISDIILLAVRPNQLEQVLLELKKIGIDEKKMIISIVAGVRLEFYKKYLKNPVLRVMPNVAAEVMMSMNIFSHEKGASVEFKSLANLLFSSFGKVIEVEEDLMDVACAISGSGSGFVFRLIEQIASFGEKRGLDVTKAVEMTAQVFMGAAKLVLKHKNPRTLIDQVVTPNGITQAGLKMMSSLKIDEHIQSVIEASEKRSKELSEEIH